jgi:HEAT repeat protein
VIVSKKSRYLCILLFALNGCNSGSNTAAAPQDSTATGSLSNEAITQLHQDYDKAVTADDKRDALVSLIEVDANNAATLLRDAYADPDPDVRKEAVLQMHDFNNQAAVVDLLLAALNDPESSVVIEAVEGLAQLRDARAIAGLKKVATMHPDEQIRVVAQDYVDQLQDDVR